MLHSLAFIDARQTRNFFRNYSSLAPARSQPESDPPLAENQHRSIIKKSPPQDGVEIFWLTIVLARLWRGQCYRVHL